MKKQTKNYFALLLLLFFQFSFSQQTSVSGVVKGSTGALAGVNVSVKGTKIKTATDIDGAYSINAEQGQYLVFTSVGMKTSTIAVGSSKIVNVTMIANEEQLSEVVVVAYGKQEKRKMVQSVAVVSAERIKDVPVASVQDILQGQASGVQVVNSSGILGSAPVIKVRGVGSLTSGGRPLFIVDGVPLNDSNLTSGQGGQSLNPLSDINPNDIETLSVLKDASATAVYGSRGSNGVVLITTKQGKKNQDAKVTVNFTTSFTKKTDILEIMNADQYRTFLSDNPSNGVTPAQVGLDSFDWVSAVTRTGSAKSVDVNVAGGSDKSTYYIGGTYLDQDGFIIGNGLRRNAARINLTTEAKPWLKVGFNLGLSQVLNDRVGSENNTAAPLTSAFLQEPVITPFDANGNYVNLGFIQNVVAIEKFDINDSNTFRISGNAFADIKLNKNFNFRTDFGIDRSALEEFQRSFEVNTPGGYASDYQAVQNRYVFTNSLNFAKKFDLHNLNVLGGFTTENTDIRDISVEGTGFPSDDLINVTSAATKTTTDNSTTSSRLIGLFSRMNYDFDNKYLFEASVRRDGSSRFGSATRYGVFWSVGGAWVVSQENFLKDNNILSSLKLKANYGVAGNDRIGDFSSRENTSGGKYPNYNGQLALVFSRYPNADLKWEGSKSYDLGVEFGFLSNRVKLNVDYYNKKTENLILNQSFSVADNQGVNAKQVNAGTMQNKGFDIDLNAEILKNTQLKWTSNFNINFNKNEILSLNSDASIDIDGNRYIQGSNSQRAIVGHSVNTFYLIPYLGVNPQTGNAEWLSKATGLPTTTPTANDRVIAGDANPDFSGGFTNTLKYKDFDLSALMTFSYGNDIYVDGLRFTEDARYNGFNKSVSLLNVWQNPGDNAVTPAYASATFATAQQRSTRQLKDGSYARLKSVTFGYTLPLANTSAAKFINNIKFYFTAQNLFTVKKNDLGGIDPEVSNSIANGVQGETFFTPPQSKTYLFGTRITF